MKRNLLFFSFLMLLIAFSSCKKEYITNQYITNENDSYYSQKVYLDKDIKEVTEDIRPAYLKEGDTVAVFAISNKVTKSELATGIAKLQSWGLNVVEAENLYGDDGRYAGTQSERIEGLQKLLDNPNIRAIIAARGGYGAVQVLPYLDMTEFMKSPKWMVGYSDLTAFHALLNNEGVETIHGAMVKSFTDEKSVESLHSALFGTLKNHSIATNSNCIEGEAEGRLVGGNLSIIYSLGGTLYDLNVKNAILLIEDTGEANYSIDRMLQNLKLSGKLDCIKGVVVGEFINNTQGSDEPLNEIIKGAFESLNIPVMYGVNIGHDTENLSTYLGRTVKLTVGSATSTLSFE